jgi:DnaJ-domain-containing protein 1
VDWQTHSAANQATDDIRDYVAQLQVHMSLQARNLVPALTEARDSREQLLQQAQADLEKMTSRHANGSTALWQTDFCSLER